MKKKGGITINIFSLENKTAIVIGGSKGLGKGIAEGLAEAGANLALCTRTKSDLDAAAAHIKAKVDGARVIGIPLDITSMDSIHALIGEVVDAFGGIDILVNCAGVNVRKPAVEFTEEDWDRVQNTQLKYVFFACQAAARYMLAQKIPGKIINVASLTSQLGLPNMIAYCAAKGGVVQLTKALANELAGSGIQVNAIGPGYFETEMTKPLFENEAYRQKLLARIPVGRTGFPEDLKGAAVFLASEASNYMTGQVIYVDGGWLAS